MQREAPPGALACVQFSDGSRVFVELYDQQPAQPGRGWSWVEDWGPPRRCTYCDSAPRQTQPRRINWDHAVSVTSVVGNWEGVSGA